VVDHRISSTFRGCKMRVDMSPDAITSRLETLGELWKLGVELMKANPKNREAAVGARRPLSEDSDGSNEEGTPVTPAELRESI
jgi:hypothetical protein